MNDKLDNEEIKELLQEDNGQKTSDKEFSGYDLTKNDSTAFSKLSSLSVINENFIRNAKTSLNEILKAQIELSVIDKQIEKSTVYLSGLQIPCSINFVKIQPIKLNGFFILDNQLVYTLVDKYFGGESKAPTKKTNKDITQIELKIIRLLLDKLFVDLRDAWLRVCDLNIEYLESETNPIQMKCTGKPDLLVVIKFRLDIGERGGELHICYPHAMILQYKELLESGTRKEISDENWLKRVKEELMEVELQARCTIAQRKISLKDVVAFKKDDIVPIEMPEEILLKINDISLFKATFGTFEGKYAVKITEKLKRTEKRA